MSIALILLALTSAPLGLVSVLSFYRSRDIAYIAGIAGAVWAFAGVLIIRAGMPGTVLFPGMLAIVLAGVVLRLHAGDRSRALIVKAFVLSSTLLFVSAGVLML